MPVADNKKLHEACIDIMVNAVQYHVNESRWAGHVFEKFTVETMQYDLSISKVLVEEIAKSPKGFFYGVA